MFVNLTFFSKICDQENKFPQKICEGKKYAEDSVTLPHIFLNCVGRSEEKRACHDPQRPRCAQIGRTTCSSVSSKLDYNQQ